MADSFDYNTLRCRYNAVKKQLAAFKSGEKYRQMQELRIKDAKDHNRVVEKLNCELSHAHSETVSVRNLWIDVLSDMQRDHEKELDKLHAEIVRLERKVLEAERARDKALDKVTEIRDKYYKVAAELEEEKGKNQKLHAQIGRDFENSSIPSSKSVKHKKIANSREKTGRKPGGQPGHKGHGRKRQEPTVKRHLPPPQEVLDDPDFKKTGRTLSKQMVGIKLLLEVTEFTADIYYNPKTNEYVHAPFPEGYVNEVNYDGSIKAFLYLLNNDCNVSIDKSRKFLSDLTGGKLVISKGMINGLAASFAKSSEEQLREVYKDLLLTPILHTDNTNAKVNGNSAFVFVCASPDGKALYYFREKKGHEGVKGTLVEDYQGILVHDHDTTFYNYGSGHQECNAHILRYLKDSMYNEPDRTWNKDMHSLMREMIHYRNGLPENEPPDASKVKGLEEKYDAVISKARVEYEDVPPSPYYRDGYNLYRRMEKYKDNHLLFLHDIRVPSTNNEAERLLRNYKRKQAQAVSFRSTESVEALCKGMSMLVLMRQKEDANIFEEVSEAFRSV